MDDKSVCHQHYYLSQPKPIIKKKTNLSFGECTVEPLIGKTVKNIEG